MAEWRGTETDRAAILSRYDLDASGFEALDDITRFAARLCDAPICIVNIVDIDRQRFVSRIGMEGTEPPLPLSFCAHAMTAPALFIVPDARQDGRFATNPLVTGTPHIRFYAGAPLVSDEGAPLGALCVIDDRPRAGLTPLQAEGLAVLAAQVMMRLQSRRIGRETRERVAQKALALSDSENRFRILADTMPQMVWSARPDGYNDYFNARWYEFTGASPGSTDGEGWSAMFHPDDREQAWALWRHSLATGEPYEIEYRLKHHSGQYRWTLGRALPVRDEQGAITRWFGTCTDIHEQKIAMEEREIVAHELSHRIKNIFSVIAGLIGISAREHPEIAEAAEDLRDRVMALGRAHDYVRPHNMHALSRQDQSPETQSPQAHNSLQGLLGQIFSPYLAQGRPRVMLTGEDCPIDDRSATPIALLFHELATNAAKYGALSNADGKVGVQIARRDGMCVIDWREKGGPAIAQAPTQQGFGSRLMALAAERQLGGRVERDWAPDGLAVRLYIPDRAMSRKTEGTA
ncbi:sensor histidine kinase [Sphingobium aquiterrae]|uniref:sensor histidine kinase n=1 Tax=Sphingobium aquiterrae TaxID=2038656 RepID=UPI003018E6C0